MSGGRCISWRWVSIPGLRTDNWAHIGGLAGGFVVAYVAGTPRRTGSPLEVVWRVACGLAILLTALSFLKWYLWFSHLSNNRDMKLRTIALALALSLGLASTAALAAKKKPYKAKLVKPKKDKRFKDSKVTKVKPRKAKKMKGRVA